MERVQKEMIYILQKAFTLPPNSIKWLSFTHPEDVLYDKGPHVNFGFAVNYSYRYKKFRSLQGK